jgi:hypothetical protein
MPIHIFLQITNASEADIRVYEKILEMLPCGSKIFADRAYQIERKPIKNQEENKGFTNACKKEKGAKIIII